MRYSDGWIDHSIPVRQLIYVLNPHKVRFSLSPILGLVLSVKSCHCFMFIYVRGEGGTKAAEYVYKMAPVVSSPKQKLSRRFSFLSFHRSLKYTFEDFRKEQEMCSRMLEWKEMS